jgi:hypothetical protein
MRRTRASADIAGRSTRRGLRPWRLGQGQDLIALGQLTQWASVATQPSSSALTRRAWPAQFGHSTNSPDVMPSGSSTIAPQSGQRTVGMSDLEQAVQPAASEAYDDLGAHRDDWHGCSPGTRDQLVARRRILSARPRRDTRCRSCRRGSGLDRRCPVRRATDERLRENPRLTRRRPRPPGSARPQPGIGARLGGTAASPARWGGSSIGFPSPTRSASRRS